MASYEKYNFKCVWNAMRFVSEQHFDVFIDEE